MNFSRDILLATLAITIGLSIPLAPSALAQPLNGVETTTSDAIVNSKGSYYARCQLVRIRDNNVVGYVTGSGKTRNEALAAANASVPLGHYKRHCQVSYGLGGRFSIVEDF